VKQVEALLTEPSSPSPDGNRSDSAIYSLLGHKGDLLMIHFRDSFEALNSFELRLASTEFFRYLEPTSSFVSVVELGLYDSSAKAYANLISRDIQPHSAEWNNEVSAVLDRQKDAMTAHLAQSIPAGRYLCFYPMDRRRGETANWYTLPMADRQRMMHEHGLIGRRYCALFVKGGVKVDQVAERPPLLELLLFSY
jgi:peroxiredoxin